MIDLVSIDHIGIRVSDFDRAMNFYGKLGFSLEIDHQDNRAYEIINKHGVRLNLICNARHDPEGKNILLDEATKYAGVTHPAFVISDIEGAIKFVNDAGIAITEGPIETDRRRYFFIRDPDGNVLEFNELKEMHVVFENNR